MVALLVACASPAGLYPLVQHSALAPSGNRSVLDAAFLFLLPFMVALLSLFVSPVLLLLGPTRVFALRLLTLAVVSIAAEFIGSRLGESIRMNAFHDLARRGGPLVKAIHSYETRNGQPPGDLRALVPEFFPTVPLTRMGAYPAYEYHVGSDAARYDGNQWVLVVNAPKAGLNWDSFIYFPLQNYPTQGYGGVLERVGKWAYIHE